MCQGGPLSHIATQPHEYWPLMVGRPGGRQKLGYFVQKILLNKRFKSFIYFSASDWSNKIPISLFQKSKCRNSMISGFSKPWNPAFIHFIIPKYFKIIQEKSWGYLRTILFFISENLGNPFVDIFRKDGHRKTMKIRPRICWKS